MATRYLVNLMSAPLLLTLLPPRLPHAARIDVPLIVLTSTDLFAGKPKEKPLWALWKSKHDEVAQISPIGVNCVVPHSTHSKTVSRPNAVIGAVSTMVQAVHGRQHVALDCAHLY